MVFENVIGRIALISFSKDTIDHSVASFETIRGERPVVVVKCEWYLSGFQDLLLTRWAIVNDGHEATFPAAFLQRRRNADTMLKRYGLAP